MADDYILSHDGKVFIVQAIDQNATSDYVNDSDVWFAMTWDDLWKLKDMCEAAIIGKAPRIEPEED